MKIFFLTFKIIPIILIFVFLQSGCGNNQHPAAADPEPQKEVVERKDVAQKQQAPSGSEEQTEKIRTVTRYYNGQEYLAFDVDPPLIDVPLSEIKERADAGEPDELFEPYVRNGFWSQNDGFVTIEIEGLAPLKYKIEKLLPYCRFGGEGGSFGLSPYNISVTPFSLYGLWRKNDLDVLFNH